MTPHDAQVAVIAWLTAITAILLAVGAMWVAVYPIITRLKRDIDALWAAHRAQGGKPDDRGT